MVLLLCLGFGFLDFAHAAQDLVEAKDIIIKHGGPAEQYERDVDQVALSSQEQAIAKLSGLMKKYRNTAKEPLLLSKLAELQQQSAAIRFRIAHGVAHGGKRPLDLTSYRNIMTGSISTLSELIRKYPHYSEIAQAFYMRGKGYEEIGDKAKAAKDYLVLVEKYPDAEEVPAAYMSLAEFSIEANDHFKAIGYLKEVEKRPDDSHYPFAIYKLAWSNYNLKNIPLALKYAEKHIDFYSEKLQKEKDKNNSDYALRENTLLDTAVFYAEGFEQKLADYSIDSALPYFKKLDNGTLLGRVLVRFIKLLRSHNHEKAMLGFKEQVLLTESERPESVDIVVIAFEDQVNKRRYKELIETAHDLTRLYAVHRKNEAFSKAQKLLLDTANSLQASILKNRNADGVTEYSKVLASIYDSFTKIVEEHDLRIPRVHYNLAETLFEIKEYEDSAKHYRWVVGHSITDKTKGTPKISEAGLKSLTARYESLKQKQMIPGSLKAVSLKSSSDSVDQLLAQWLLWIDEYVDAFGFKGKHKDAVENIYFEANRALYHAGDVKRATDRMSRFSLKNPSSKFAIPSASLALDTYIETNDWEATHELARDYLDIEEWEKKEFSKKVFLAAADAFYKIVEEKHKQRDYGATVKLANEFIEDYSASPRLQDCLSLAGNSALALGEKDMALGYFTKLIDTSPSGEVAPAALLARAAIEEERYQFLEASQDYRQYVSLNKQSDSKIAKKILILAWFSGELSELRLALDSPVICNHDLAEECDLYSAFSILQSSKTEEGVVQKAISKSKKGFDKSKAVWATIALRHLKEIEFSQRLLLVKRIAGNWDKLDPFSQFALIPFISELIPKAIEASRLSISSVAPLRADPRHISRRVEWMREIENTATRAMKLPWTRIRALALNEVAALYLDFAKSLQTLKAPKSLPENELAEYQETVSKIILPFEEKGQDLRGKAFEIASKAAIEIDSFNLIAKPFFKDNPSQAKTYKLETEIATVASLDMRFIYEFDSWSGWNSKVKEKVAKSSDQSKRARVEIRNALLRKNFGELAFLLQEAKEKKLLEADIIGIIRGVSLAVAGAQAEALSELDQVCADSDDSGTREELAKALVDYYERAFAADKVQALRKRFLTSS